MVSEQQRADVLTQQLQKVENGKGFIAALDQSGGSTPKALRLYGVGEDEYSGEEEMFAEIHKMRTRIVTSKHFNGERIVGAILFERTMDGEIAGKPSARYLWEDKGVVPFLKIDKGLAAEANGVQLMKDIPDLDALLKRASRKGIFGTKERSVIKKADEQGIKQIVDQQFEIGRQVLAHGLVPILEPEVDINSSTKKEAEELLAAELIAQLDKLPKESRVMLKLTLPTETGLYADCIRHPNVVRVVALSGGYSRAQANELLAQNEGMIASFSRALTEGLSAQQTAEEFDRTLDEAIESIFQASKT